MEQIKSDPLEEGTWNFWWFLFAIVFISIFGISLQLEVILFLFPRKGKQILEYYGYPVAQDNIGVIQLSHVLGFFWSLAQLIYIFRLPTYPKQSADLNPDIVGRGILFSNFAPSGGLIIASILGYFHVSESGAKELGQVQLFALLCLTINIWKWWKKLKDPELLVVLILIDSTCSALSIMLTDKQVLSARKLVYLTSFFQVLAMGVVGYVMSHWSASEGSFRIFWWGGITDSNLSPNLLFWCFYIVRACSILRGILRSVMFTHAFNNAERQAGEQPLQNHRANHADGEAGTHIPSLLTASTPLRLDYSECVATTSIAPIEHLPHIIASIASTVRLLQQIDPESGNWPEWGQLAQVIITVLAMLHWLGYTICFRLLWKRRSSFRGRQRRDGPMRMYLQLLDNIFPANIARSPRYEPWPRDAYRM